MGDSLKFQDWLNRAKSDLRGAEILHQYDGGNELVSFHCQQSVEKTLKAWLLKERNELQDGHSLVYLCKRAMEAGAPIKEQFRDCGYLNQFYIETRYPSDNYIPGSEREVQDCLNIAHRMMDTLFPEKK